MELNISISQFFVTLQRIARKRIILKYSLLICTFVGASWILLFASDRLINTPKEARFLLFGVGLLLSLWAIWRLLTFGFHFCTNHSWLAKRVRDQYRGKGERLLGIIEIAGERNSFDHTFSTQIFQAAQQKMVGEIDSIHREKVFPWKVVTIPTVGACSAIFIIFFLSITFPELSSNSFQRWIHPFSNLERMTLTQFLQPDINSFYIVKDESSPIRFSLTHNCKLKPNQARLIHSGDQPFHLISRLNGNIYDFEIPPKSNPFSVSLSGGDFHQRYKFYPITRPEIESMQVKINFPDYLCLDTVIQEGSNQKIKIPENTSISLSGSATRTLSQVLITDEHSQVSTLPQSTKFRLNLSTINQDRNFNIHILDEYGLSPRKPFSFPLEIQEDLPATTEFSPLIDVSPILVFETRMIDFLAEDDFGLSEVSLDLRVIEGKTEVLSQTVLQKELPKGGHINENHQFPFDPSIFQLTDGQEVIFSASAKDHFPNREPTFSKPLRFKIIGPEKHAAMIKAKIDGIISDVSEIARNQEAVQFETLSMQEKITRNEEASLNENHRSDIQELQRDQKGLASQLKSTANNGLTIMNEAAKNPFFDPETLQGFATSLNDMISTSSNPMKQAGQKLQSASSSNPSRANQEMMESAQFQEDALDQLRDILSKFSQQVDKLEAMTLAQRLQKLEETERKLSKKVVSTLPSSIGRSPSQLQSKNRKYVFDMESLQSQASLDAKEIQAEISRYHERTQKAEYGKVSQLMEEANTEQRLAFVAENLRNNISFQALNDLNYWEKTFALWAKLLQQEAPGGDSPGGEASGKDKTQDILSLLKMRKKQSEIILKTKTLSSEIFKGNTQKWASSLKDQQDILMIDLTDTQISVAEEALNPLFDDAHMAMSDSSSQLGLQVFDEITESAQIEAKDILSDLINLLLEGQGQGKGTKGNENLTAMEMLMMQMENKNAGKSKGQSPVAGKTGGGSNQTGSTDQVTNSLQGSSADRQKVSSPTKSSGSATPSIAPEYQEAMQKYFKAIED